MGRKRNRYLSGSVGLVGSAAWGLYSNLTTIKDLPDDAKWIAKIIADPPVYAPWLLFVVCAAFLAWVFWEREGGYEDTPHTTNQQIAGNGNQQFGSIHNSTIVNALDAGLKSAAAPHVVSLLSEIEKRYCGSVSSLYDKIKLHETFEKNLDIVVGNNFGQPFISKEQFNESQDFFQDGQTVLTININEMGGGAMPQISLPKGRVVYVNLTKSACTFKDDLSRDCESPFLQDDVIAGLQELKSEIDSIFSSMISFLDARLQRQPMRISTSASDRTVCAGLFNEFMRESVQLDEKISNIRRAIRQAVGP